LTQPDGFFPSQRAIARENARLFNSVYHIIANHWRNHRPRNYLYHNFNPRDSRIVARGDIRHVPRLRHWLHLKSPKFRMKAETLQHQLSGRFDALSALHDGWLDGKGLAPDKQKLREVCARMATDYPQHIALPAIVPTPEGNLLFEWTLPGDPSVDLHLDTMRAAFHAFQPAESEIERDFLLTSNHAWNQFFDFLSRALGTA
jgi:hypothetical protein